MAFPDQIPSNVLVAPDNLIPVFDAIIGGKSVHACCARALHAFMEVKRDFSTWIKNRIDEYGFIQDQDFLVHQNGGTKTGRGGNRKAVIDYHLTLDMAKELSMVERNEKGREARRYFIECERRMLEQAQSAALRAEAQPQSKSPPLPWIDWSQKFTLDATALPGEPFDAGKALAQAYLVMFRGHAAPCSTFLLLKGYLRRMTADFAPEDLIDPHRRGAAPGARALECVLSGFLWEQERLASLAAHTLPDDAEARFMALVSPQPAKALTQALLYPA